MEDKRIVKTVAVGVLVGALAYSLFGNIGLIGVALYYVFKLL